MLKQRRTGAAWLFRPLRVPVEGPEAPPSAFPMAPANNPISPGAERIQGPDPTGNLGYPLAVVPAPGVVFPVSGAVGGGGGATGTPGDGFANPVGVLQVQDFLQLWNGGSWDEARNNVSLALLPSLSRTTAATASFTNFNHCRLALLVNVTSAGTGSISPSLAVVDSVSAAVFTVWTAAAPLTAVGTYGYYFADGAGGSGTWTEKLAWGPPGRSLQLIVLANNPNAVIYSVSGELMV